MSRHIVSLAQTPPSPWRNGGGVTRELAAWPDAQHWRWRLSVAEVTRSGPFSRFDGVQRWFAVLAGAGVRLTLDGATHELDRHSAPFAFDGAAGVECDLLAGATQDFNLMLRGAGVARMQRLSGASSHVLERRTSVALYADDASATLGLGAQSTGVAAHSLAWRELPAGSQVQVQASNALWMEIEP